MAADTNVPPDKYYFCHPKQKVNTVICLICENVYHSKDFYKLENTKTINFPLVICPKHNASILTSKIDTDLSESAKIIISQVKNAKLEDCQKQLYEDLVNQTSKSNQSPNVTMLEEEDTQLKVENALLRKINSTLEDKIKLLEELLEHEKSSNQVIVKQSYSEAIKHTYPSPKPKKIAKIIIERKNEQDNINIKDTVTHYLNREKTIQTKNINTKNPNRIIITCMNEESVNTATSVLDKCKKLNIEKETIKNPKIKIVGIDNCSKMDMKDFENDIIARNFPNNENSITILHMYTTKKNSTTLIAEVTSNTYQSIKTTKNRLFVGYQSCKIHDIINTRPCYNCGGYNHSGSKCKNEPICMKCAGAHKTTNCNSDMIKCMNCSYSNKTYKKNYNTNHLCYDTQACQILNNKIKREIDNTDYPCLPEVPRYMYDDKVGTRHDILSPPTLPPVDHNRKRTVTTTSTPNPTSTKNG